MPPNDPSNDLTTETPAQGVLNLFKWMEEKVGIDVADMFKGDDWLLVIKLHAMIESALNLALVTQLREPKLETVIGKLDTSDGSRGKVAFVKALGMLDKSSLDFIQALSALRNLCVHNIRNFKFDLAAHLTEPKKGPELRRALLKGMECLQSPNSDMQNFLVKDSPRVAVFLGCMGVMMQLHYHNELCRARDVANEDRRLKAVQFDRLNQIAQIEPDQSTPKES